jgi:hypothetical protein
MNLINFLKQNGKLYYKLNLVLFHTGCTFLIVMIPFYKIDPIFLCETHDFDKDPPFRHCSKEEICNNEFDSIDDQNSALSFKYSYYKSLKNEIKIDCSTNRFILLNYLVSINYLGVISADLFFDKMRSTQRDSIINLLLYVSAVFTNISFYLIYLSVVDFSFLIFFLMFFNGFIFCLFTRISLICFSNQILISEFKKESERITNTLNLIFPASAAINIILYFYFRSWIINYIVYGVSLACCLLFLMIMLIKEHKSKIILPLNSNFKMVHLNSTNQLTNINYSKLQLYSNKENSKLQNKSYLKYLYLFLFFVNSISYNSFNLFIDFYSYDSFNDESLLLINGLSSYVSEIISFSISCYIIKKCYEIYIMFIPLILGIASILLEVTKHNKWNFTLTIILFFSKFFTVVFQGFVISSLQKLDSNKMISIKKITFLSRISIFITNILIDFSHIYLILISLFYFISFLLIFKISNDK